MLIPSGSRGTVARAFGRAATALFLVAVLGLSLAGCRAGGAGEPTPAGDTGNGTAGETETITLKGSDTMVILGQRWAEEYMKADKKVLVQVTGGGSGTGVAALINGATDIAQASRQIKSKEADDIQEKFGRPVEELRMALDAVAIYLNEDNPVSELTIAQLKDLYTGKVTNWSAVGGPDKPIILYGRDSASGTRAFVHEVVLDKEDFADTCQPMMGTAAIVNAVSRDEHAIGYGGIAYAEGIKYVAVSEGQGHPYVMASEETVSDGSYPLRRYLHWYAIKGVRPAVQKFIDWALSPEGQEIVVEVGYFPVEE